MEEDKNLEKEMTFFKENQPNLVKKYKGKFLVIKDKEVKGFYDTELEAYSESQKKFELGTFLIQECLPGIEAYTQSFHSRVYFQ